MPLLGNLGKSQKIDEKSIPRQRDFAEKIDCTTATAAIPEQASRLCWKEPACLTERADTWSALTGEICHDRTNSPVLDGGSSSLAFWL
jgi:hypothetical protein